MGQAKRKAEAAVAHLVDCADFIEALDRLICRRIEQKVFAYSSGDEIELIKREMKDFVRRNSAAKGIYVEADDYNGHK